MKNLKNMTIRPFMTLILGLGLCFPSLFAQNTPDFWGRISPDQVVLTGTAERQHEPLKYKALTLDYAPIAAYLNNAPREFTAAARKKAFQVVLPLADGKKETFAVVKVGVMDAALEALHPEIGTYAGEALNTPGMQVRITVSPSWGFHAFITRSDKGIEYIEPVALGQNQYYMVYDRNDMPRDIRQGQVPTQIVASPSDQLQEESLPRFSLADPEPGTGEKLLGAPVNLKVYKFACAATGEFSQDNGGTKDAVFAKITQFTNQLNAIYERDINIRLVLIPESYNIIFLDPVTDPYTGTEVGGWMSQNPVAMLTYLGSPDNYDIGHVFARYLGGPAIGVAGGLCCTQFKGRGCSAWYGPPYGDEFFAIVGQEIGHQWNSGHTFNNCQSDSQYNPDSACEPGSGSTIMSYSGVCGSNNVSTGNTALYYHACSIAEIRRFYQLEVGATCGSTLATSNTAPSVSTAYPQLTFIPIRTPFELTGAGTDMDGDALTYSWDEIDVDGPPAPLGSPVGNSPAFRWFAPTNNPTRTFPRIQTIVANASTTTEVLPTYERKITFVLIARDNQLNGGGVGWDTVRLRATPLAGPFLVSYPNDANITWKVGESQIIIWDVANTDNAVVNCKKVNIKLSLDNGTTYPVTLASGVPNVGKYCIQVPDNVGTNNRIRVEAADNVFFDISNIKFAIVQPTPGISLCAAVAKENVCLPGNYSLSISTTSLSGFSAPITLSATGLPNGATATFSPNPVQPGNAALMTVSFSNNTPESTFDLSIQGSATGASSNTITTLTVINNNFAAFSLATPVDGATGVNKLPILTWNTVPDADLYDVELATNPSFEPGVLVSSKQNVTVGTFQVSVVLEEGKVYYWHVRPKNTCGNGPWSVAQVFVVGVQSCGFHEAADLPKNISANSTPTVESKITLASGGAISDVNIKKIQGTHTFFKDLEAHLISPSGTDVLLWKDKCPQNTSFNFGIDDGATGVFGCPPPNNGTIYKSTDPLSAFIGQTAAGVWTLRVKDNQISSGGSLLAFELEICSNVALNPPLIIKNDVLTLAPGNNAAIGDNLLKAEDADNGPSDLIFTLMSLPKNGQLFVNGVPATVGTQFTQTDITNGALRYFDFGLNLGADSFNFSVTDNQGGLAKGTYVVQPFAVSTHEPNASITFDLAPNPTSATTVLFLSQSLRSEARVTLFNLAGQVVGNWQLAAGANSLRMEMEHLPKGVYAVSLENEQTKSVKKLVLQ